jgi:hypothetical protein
MQCALRRSQIPTLQAPLSPRTSHPTKNRGAPHPRFPVKSRGFPELHAPFLDERRTRFPVQSCEQEIRGISPGAIGPAEEY